MMTVSAAVRLIPSPPALVHSRNTNLSESREGEEGGREGGRGREEKGSHEWVRVRHTVMLQSD